MTATLPSASVVIATHLESRWDQLRSALLSLQHQSSLPSEIVVVVDNNPKLLSRAAANLGEALVVENTEGPGLAGARNTGCAASSSEVVAFIDDDAEALPDWLERLLPPYLDHCVLGVGGAIEPLWPMRPRWFPPEFDWVVGCSYRGLPTRAASVRNLIGCNMSFRRLELIESGGFKSGIGRTDAFPLPLGCEETELCIRMRRGLPGRELIYEPQAIVRHRVPIERRRWRYLAGRCYAEGLSKAQVAFTVGRRDGLSSERTYVLRTLPAAVARSLSDFVLRRSPGGLRRSACIVSGLLLTAAGYGYGRIAGRSPQPAP
jgi:glycosyltransferase involved in cell wall biosynthesis